MWLLASLLPKQETLSPWELSLEPTNASSGYCQGPGAAYLFHQSFPIQGPAVILMNVLFSPVL